MVIEGASRTIQSQTPNMNFVSGPTQLYPNGTIKRLGLTPGATYIVAITTFNVPAPPGCVDFHFNFNGGGVLGS
jgi:hypothetical protein